MSKNKTWAPPGWPWELDILALVFVIIALAVPLALSGAGSTPAADVEPVVNPATSVLKEQQSMLWAVGIVVLFVMHLAVAGASLETISTPFIHLVSPMAFALIAYYRVFTVTRETAKATIVTGSPLQIAVLILAVAAATLLVARIRMARYLLRFRDVKWDVVTPAKYDSSYFELITQFEPLIYPPRSYRACDQGLLIEGWFYIMSVPFEMVQSINAVNTFGFASNGKYHASSKRGLIRMELLDNSEPLFISPQNRDEMLQYCAHHVTRIRPTSAKAGTKSGGRSTTHGGGDAPARHTHHEGIRKV